MIEKLLNRLFICKFKVKHITFYLPAKQNTYYIQNGTNEIKGILDCDVIFLRIGVIEVLIRVISYFLISYHIETDFRITHLEINIFEYF